MKNVASRVRIRLIELNMTQKELAQALGVTRQHLNAVLHGRLPSKALEEALGEWLDETKKDR
jgi:transcriptional regulator with XRE-family HTH domain